MLDRYENCLFSELCLCGVDLKVDFRIHARVPQYDINFVIKWIPLSALYNVNRQTCALKFSNRL